MFRTIDSELDPLTARVISAGLDTQPRTPRASSPFQPETKMAVTRHALHWRERDFRRRAV